MQNTLTNTQSISDIIKERANKAPHAVALQDGQTSMDNQALWQLVNSTAQTLVQHDITCLGIYMDNCIDWAVMDLAALHAGLTVIPIPLFFTAQQINHLINDAGIQAVVVHPSQKQKFEVSQIITVDGLDAQLLKLTNANTQNLLRLRNQFVTPVAKVTYTSGSTGKPKGVCLSQENMMAAVVGLADALKDEHLSSHLCILPLATLLENIAGVYLPLYMGSSVILEPLDNVGLRASSSFDSEQFLAALKQHQPSSIIILPELLKKIVESPNITPAHVENLRFVAVGGGKTPLSILHKAQNLGLPVYEGYGLSECSSVVSLNTPSTHQVGSVGKPLSHVQIEIDQNGEVLIKGQAMLGYLHESLDEQPAGGHVNTIKTGDLAYFDEAGFLYINGRSKNLIITSFGRNVSPEWVEANMLQEHGFIQAAVFGEAKPFLCATIVSTLSQHEIQHSLDKINQTLPDYARIHKYIVVAPFTQANGLLTANGRLKRDAIYEQYQHQLEQVYRAVV